MAGAPTFTAIFAAPIFEEWVNTSHNGKVQSPLS